MKKPSRYMNLQALHQVRIALKNSVESSLKEEKMLKQSMSRQGFMSPAAKPKAAPAAEVM